MSIDLRSGRRTVVARIRSDNDYGPWVWRGRAIWVEQRSRGVSGDYTLVRSAPLGE